MPRVAVCAPTKSVHMSHCLSFTSFHDQVKILEGRRTEKQNSGLLLRTEGDLIELLSKMKGEEEGNQGKLIKIEFHIRKNKYIQESLLLIFIDFNSYLTFDTLKKRSRLSIFQISLVY